MATNPKVEDKHKVHAAAPTKPSAEAKQAAVQPVHFPVQPVVHKPEVIAEAPVDKAHAPAKPKDFKDALAQLQAANALPEVSRHDKQVKAARVETAKKAVADTQQGLPVVDMTANKFEAARPEGDNDEIIMNRIRLKARSDQDLAYLLNKIEPPKAKPDEKHA